MTNKNRTLSARFCNTRVATPAAPYRSLPGPPGIPKESPKSKKRPKQSRNSLRSLKIDCFETPDSETVFRLFRTLSAARSDILILHSGVNKSARERIGRQNLSQKVPSKRGLWESYFLQGITGKTHTHNLQILREANSGGHLLGRPFLFTSDPCLTFFHADFGKECPSRTFWRDPSRNCPSPSSALCPLLYRTEHFLRGRKWRKHAEKGRGRGVASKGVKEEKRTCENRSDEEKMNTRDGQVKVDCCKVCCATFRLTLARLSF